MNGIDDHAHAPGLEHLGDAGSDLRRELFLHLEPPRIPVDDPRQLADSDDLLGRQVSDMHMPDDRSHVMFAMRLEGDVAQHDHLIVPGDFVERATQILRGIDRIAGEPVAISVHDPLRRVAQPLTLRVVSGPLQQRADRLFGFFPGGCSSRGCGHSALSSLGSADAV